MRAQASHYREMSHYETDPAIIEALRKLANVLEKKADAHDRDGDWRGG